jgi:SRSO17 transposase
MEILLCHYSALHFFEATPDWAYVELADLEAAEYNADLTGPWTRGLLIRRNIFDQDLAFFSTWCPAGTDIATLVRVEGQRWAIEDAFETAKTELGLTHNETRSWHGWHRHVSLVMLALAMMTVVRQRANRLTSPQKSRDAARLSRWCAGRSRKSAAWPHTSPSVGSSPPS